MTANNRAGSQLTTLAVLNTYIERNGYAPGLDELAELRNMTTGGIRYHMLYLMRQGYILKTGKHWRDVLITEKGASA